MIFESQKLVHVYYNGRDARLLMGRLLLKDRKLFFEYGSEFIKTGLELSPYVAYFMLIIESHVLTMK